MSVLSTDQFPNGDIRGGRQEKNSLYTSYNGVQFRLEYTHVRTPARKPGEKCATRSKDENAVESKGWADKQTSAIPPNKKNRKSALVTNSPTDA